MHAIAGILTTSSRSAAVIAGSNVSFNCQSSDKIRWNFYKPFSKDPVRLHTGYKLHPEYERRYQVITDPWTGLNTLHAISVHFNHSGSYDCLEMDTSDYWITFELIVLGMDTTNKNTIYMLVLLA